MTFSIVARSPDGSCWGVAVASKYLAAGAAVPAAQAGVGALATQALVNRGYRPQGMALLGAGLSAAAVVAALTAADDERDERQLGVVDAAGGSATFTGAACLDWAGGVHGPGYAVQGNLLAGPAVVAEAERALLADGTGGGAGEAVPAGGAGAMPLARGLFAALAAGDAAGGDRRGRQSAGLLVVDVTAGTGAGADVRFDLRVDDHQDPVAELGRLLDLGELYFGTPDPATLLPLEGALAAEVAERVGRLGHPTLDAWADVANYEGRLVPGKIDPVVLARLREATG
jgi:uncharacterized Ntn-hydrolase superfamily protein